MSTTIGELFIDLVVDAGKSELTVGNLVKSMGELEVASVGEIAVLAELASKLAQITDAQIKSALGLHQYTAETGASTQALQEWESAARHTAAGAGVVKPALLSISEQLEDIQRFGEGSHAPIRNLVNVLRDVSFSGLDPKHPEQLLERIRKSNIFQKMTPADQFGALRHAGLGDLLELEQMSQAKFLQYKKETVPMSDREIEKYRTIFDSMASIEAVAANIKRLIADWASDSTIAFLNKTLKLFQLELDSLKAIKEYYDNRKTGQSIISKTTPLAPEAVKDVGKDLWSMAKALIFLNTGYSMKSGSVENALSPASNRTPINYTPKSGSASMTNNWNINGSTFTVAQLKKVVRDEMTWLHQEIAPQVDPMMLR